jgi:hypothetical protein
MKMAVFDLETINIYFNVAHQRLDEILEKWEKSYGRPAVYSSDMMKEIFKGIVSDYLRELFLENDLYFFEA